MTDQSTLDRTTFSSENVGNGSSLRASAKRILRRARNARRPASCTPGICVSNTSAFLFDLDWMPNIQRNVALVSTDLERDVNETTSRIYIRE